MLTPRLLVFVFVTLILLLNSLLSTCGQIGKKGTDVKVKRNAPWYCERGTVCMDDGGVCFDNGPFTAFCHQYYLPQTPEQIGAHFELYYRRQVYPLDYGRLEQDTRRLNRTLFPTGARLWAIVHGFTPVRDMDAAWIETLKQSLLEKNHPVLICNWVNGSMGPNYIRAVANTRVVGAMVAKVLEKLQSSAGLRLDATTIVGFSLGAHVAGFAGKQLGFEGFDDRHRLAHIIGLDPAGPLFANGNPLSLYNIDPIARLSPDDARLVQVLHTNGHEIFSGEAGTLQTMGTLDFYPNGGQLQPGCEDEQNLLGTIYDSVWNIDFGRIFGSVACSHRAAPQFLIDSIRYFNTSTDSEVQTCGRPKTCQCHSYAEFLSGACCLEVTARNSTRMPQKHVTFGYALTLLSPAKTPRQNGKFFFETNSTEYTRRCRHDDAVESDSVGPRVSNDRLRAHPVANNDATSQSGGLSGGYLLSVYVTVSGVQWLLWKVIFVS